MMGPRCSSCLRWRQGRRRSWCSPAVACQPPRVRQAPEQPHCAWRCPLPGRPQAACRHRAQLRSCPYWWDRHRSRPRCRPSCLLMLLRRHVHLQHPRRAVRARAEEVQAGRWWGGGGLGRCPGSSQARQPWTCSCAALLPALQQGSTHVQHPQPPAGPNPPFPAGKMLFTYAFFDRQRPEAQAFFADIYR